MDALRFNEVISLVLAEEKGIKGKEMNAAQAARFLKSMKNVCLEDDETRIKMVKFLVKYL